MDLASAQREFTEALQRSEALGLSDIEAQLDDAERELAEIRRLVLQSTPPDRAQMTSKQPSSG